MNKKLASGLLTLALLLLPAGAAIADDASVTTVDTVSSDPATAGETAPMDGDPLATPTAEPVPSDIPAPPETPVELPVPAPSDSPQAPVETLPAPVDTNPSETAPSTGGIVPTPQPSSTSGAVSGGQVSNPGAVQPPAQTIPGVATQTDLPGAVAADVAAALGPDLALALDPSLADGQPAELGPVLSDAGAAAETLAAKKSQAVVDAATSNKQNAVPALPSLETISTQAAAAVTSPLTQGIVVVVLIGLGVLYFRAMNSKGTRAPGSLSK
ncbi:hypothetical protein ACQQCD_10565 [Pseudarthrobacter sp. J1763]|uniref:hypothetical protein n=1 Tax=Pseudarthrobacter sp. J1763 TaxID=3420445 RepID=UPI003D26BC5D